MVHDTDYFAGGTDGDNLASFFSGKIALIFLFQSGFTDHIGRIIIFGSVVIFLQLLRTDKTGIAKDMGII